MATLIQSKQIEGVVTASVIQGDFNISGSLIVSGSGIITNALSASIISASTIIGDGAQITNISYNQLSNKPVFKAGSNVTITSESVSSTDIITISSSGSGGGTSDYTQLINVPNGIISGSSQITALGFVSSSASVPTGTISSSAQITALGFVSSSDSVPAGTISGSSQLTSSYDERYTLSGSVQPLPSNVVSGSSQISYTGLSNVPAGIISSSQQLPQGLVSGSSQVLGGSGVLSGSHIDISALNQFSSSIQSQVDALIASTSSYLTSETDSQTLTIVGDQLTISDGNTITIPTGSGGGISSWNDLTDIPNGLISSSQQLPQGLVSGSSQVLGGTGVYSGSIPDLNSLNTFTQSIDSRVDNLENATGSYLTSLNGAISSSSQVVLGDVIGFTTYSSSIDSRIDNISVSSTPAGTISSSAQITALGFVTSSEESPFNGDRVVSNTLLGDLYSESYNAGTSGSLREFIEQVFFPSSAPTATFTTQTANLNTNLATNGTNLESISITDTVDDSPYVVTLGGANASSLTPIPTNADSSSWELRANGDLTVGTYTYDVTITDSASATRTYSGRTLTIAQASSGTMSVNGTLYIIESATSGVITLSSTGRPGSTGVVSVSYSPNYGSQVATNFTSSNPLIAINSTNGQLSVGSPISGSGNLSGDTITSTISWEDQYGNTDSDTISVNVTTNFAPTRSTTLTTNNNTNQATGSAQIIRLTVTDTESDSIPNSGLVWGDYNSTYFTATVSSPYMYLNANNISIPAGVYPYTASFSDIHGFRTSSYSSSVTINQAVVGTLGGDTTSYIIESAESGDSLRDVTGFNAGNSSQLTVSYSPNYGSQLVQSFTSSNPSILVSNNGLLTIGVDLSGSVTQSGDTILTDITFQDQYGNVGSGSVTVNVFSNNAPTITFVSSSNYTDTTAISGSNAGTITISDTESNTPFQVSLGGTDGGKFDISGSNSPYKVQPTGSLEEGTYTISITATDDYGKTTTITNKNIIVDSTISLTPVYIYYSNYGNDTGLTNSYTTLMGAATLDSSTPPKVTSYTANTLSPYYRIKSGDLGNSTINLSGGASAILASNISGSDFNTTIRSAGNMGWASGVQTIIIVPSGSSMTGIPTSMTDSTGGSTIGEYVLVEYADGTTAPLGATNSIIQQITLDSAIGGYSDWFVIGAKQQNNASGMRLQIISSSGSISNF